MRKNVLKPWLNSCCHLVFISLSIIVLLPVVSLLIEVFFYDGSLSLQNFYDVFGQERSQHFSELSRNTLVVACLSIVISISIGVPSGYLLFRTRLKSTGIWIFLIILAAAIPLFVSSTAWITTIGNDNWYNYEHWWEKALIAGLVQGLCYSPAVTIISGIAFASGNAKLEEEALLNTGRLSTFLKVNIPNASWGIAAAIAFVYAMSTQDISITDTLRLRTYAETVYTEFNLPDFGKTNIADTGEIIESHKHLRATAVSIPVIIFDFILASIFWFYFYRHGKASAMGNEFQLQRYKPEKPLLINLFLMLLAISFFLVPLVFLTRTIGNWEALSNGFLSIKDSLFMHLPLAIITALLTSLLAVYWTRLIIGRAPWLIIPVLLLLVLPAPLIGIAIINTYNNELTGYIYDSKAILIITWMIRCLPFAVLILIPSFRLVHHDYRDNAKLAGASLLQEFFHLDLPMNWRAILAALMMIIILSLSELGASFLVIPPGTPTLTVRFFTLIHFQVYADCASLCFITLFAFVLPVTIIFFLLWRYLEKRYQ